jgi:hypothetical protein
VFDLNVLVGLQVDVDVGEVLVGYFRQILPRQSPSNVVVQVESKTSLTIRWQPPPYTILNEIILGYRVDLRSSSIRRCALFLNKSYFPKKINCIANETKFNIFLNTNASTRRIILGNLVEDMKYCVKVAAYTKVGSGPFSQPTICTDMNRKNSITAKYRTYIDKFRDIMIEAL